MFQKPFFRISIIGALSRFLQVYTAQRAREEEALRSVTRYALYTGRRLLEYHQNLRKGFKEDLSLFHQTMDRLVALGNELLGMAGMMENLNTTIDETQGYAVRFPGIIHDVWVDLLDEYGEIAALKVNADQDFEVPARKIHMSIVISRILEWFIIRQSPDGTTPLVRVTHADAAGRIRLTFEDESPRLAAELRRDIFQPFTDPLYIVNGATDHSAEDRDNPKGGRLFGLFLARILVEGIGGRLEDHTEAREDERGHRLTLDLPLRKSTGETGAGR